MRKALVVRLGAYGDMVMITPVLSRLKELDYEVVLNTNDRGHDLLKGDPRIDRFILHDKNMPLDDLGDHWKKMKEEEKPDKFINFTSSIEINVALHMTQPLYTKPKGDRAAVCDRNYYDVTNEWSGLEGCANLPSLYFTEEEEEDVKSCFRKDWYNVVWVLSGSGKQKVYPWTDFVMGSLIKDYPKIHFITVGDKKCKILENITHSLPKENFTELAGEIPIRKSMLLTKYADLVVSPDTGILHAAGCYKTPKIGLLGHTTKNNITKYFKNDYSLEADCNCSPCFYLIYDYTFQCPIEPVTNAAWCMAVGMEPEKVYNQIKFVKETHGTKERHNS